MGRSSTSSLGWSDGARCAAPVGTWTAGAHTAGYDRGHLRLRVGRDCRWFRAAHYAAYRPLYERGVNRGSRQPPRQSIDRLRLPVQVLHTRSPYASSPKRIRRADAFEHRDEHLLAVRDALRAARQGRVPECALNAIPSTPSTPSWPKRDASGRFVPGNLAAVKHALSATKLPPEFEPPRGRSGRIRRCAVSLTRATSRTFQRVGVRS
jgi:hypothetical protein